MAPVKRKYYSYELKNEIIQILNSGIKRSEVIKKYGINSGLLSKWISGSEKIAAKVSAGKGKVGKAKSKKTKGIDQAVVELKSSEYFGTLYHGE